MSTDLSLTQVQQGEGTPWYFLPGGPGMGSESLKDLIYLQQHEAPIYRVDLSFTEEKDQLARWQQSILELSQQQAEVIWVGHSFGGMLLQTIPQLQDCLKGLVLINTAPDNQWFTTFASRALAYKLPNVSQLKKNLIEHPSDESYKAYMLNSINYYFTNQGLAKGLHIFQNCNFKVKPYLWSLQYFHPSYQALWVPTCPTLIITSDSDKMTPANSYDLAPYQAPNFKQFNIKNAGHFPWVESPEEVAQCFFQFAKELNQ